MANCDIIQDAYHFGNAKGEFLHLISAVKIELHEIFHTQLISPSVCANKYIK